MNNKTKKNVSKKSKTKLKKTKAVSKIKQDDKDIIEELKKDKEIFREKIKSPSSIKTKGENILERKMAQFNDEQRKSIYTRAISNMENYEER